MSLLLRLTIQFITFHQSRCIAPSCQPPSMREHPTHCAHSPYPAPGPIYTTREPTLRLQSVREHTARSTEIQKNRRRQTRITLPSSSANLNRIRTSCCQSTLCCHITDRDDVKSPTTSKRRGRRPTTSNTFVRAVLRLNAHTLHTHQNLIT
jgi:hypothetical protein